MITRFGKGIEQYHSSLLKMSKIKCRAIHLLGVTLPDFITAWGTCLLFLIEIISAASGNKKKQAQAGFSRHFTSSSVQSCKIKIIIYNREESVIQTTKKPCFHFCLQWLKLLVCLDKSVSLFKSVFLTLK